jgi:hypothetical protein
VTFGPAGSGNGSSVSIAFNYNELKYIATALRPARLKSTPHRERRRQHRHLSTAPFTGVGSAGLCRTR